jgi:hypothetical protein
MQGGAMMTTGWLPPTAGGAMLGGPLRFAAMMVDAIERGATVYWSFFGPFGEAAISAVEMTATMQRRYLAWVAESFGVSASSFAPAGGARAGVELVGWGARD